MGSSCRQDTSSKRIASHWIGTSSFRTLSGSHHCIYNQLHSQYNGRLRQSHKCLLHKSPCPSHQHRNSFQDKSYIPMLPLPKKLWVRRVNTCCSPWTLGRSPSCRPSTLTVLQRRRSLPCKYFAFPYCKHTPRGIPHMMKNHLHHWKTCRLDKQYKLCFESLCYKTQRGKERTSLNLYRRHKIRWRKIYSLFYLPHFGTSLHCKGTVYLLHRRSLSDTRHKEPLRGQ